MAKFSFSTTTTTTIATTTTTTSHLSTLVLSDFFLFCSFILTHPLYFSYFIFFSPYLLKLISFLSPLFITTFLLLIALLTISPNVLFDVTAPSYLESKDSFLLSSYHTILNTLRSRLDSESNEEIHLFEDLEACIEGLEKSIFEVGANSLVQTKWQEDSLDIPHDIHVVDSPTYHHVGDSPKEVLKENKSLDSITQVQVREKHTNSMSSEFNNTDAMSSESNNTDENQYGLVMVMGSDAKVKFDSVNVGEENTPKAAPTLTKTTDKESPRMLESCGSMRKEKEWKRTLACKLYEERRTVDGVDGGEGMDLLWEAYEAETGKKMTTTKINNNNNNNNNSEKVKKDKKREIEYEEEKEEDEEEDEDMNAQLCCLQALKFSTRKMNLGMGRPNLVKISKALKGIGWFHHGSKHGKKGYN